MQAVVSIIVPTFNRSGFLAAAVSSATAQTEKRLEIIILDDASPDNTQAVGSALAAGDPRVIYVRQPKNLGIAANWRDGFARARGEFLCILHDDDTFEPEFVASLLEPLQKDPATAMAFCDQWAMSPEGVRLSKESDEMSRRFGRDQLPDGIVADLRRVALIQFSLPVGATLFRRSALSSTMIRDEAQGAIDYWLFYQIVRTGATAHYVSRRLMNYRLHAGGMSGGQPIYMSEGHLFRLKAALEDPAMADIWQGLRQQRAEVLTGYGIALLRQNRTGEARRALIAAVFQRPTLRAAIALALSLMGPLGSRAACRLTRA